MRTKTGFQAGQWLLMACAALMTAGADAGAAQMDEIRIMNIPDSRGKVVSAFYVSGREGALSTSGQSLRIRSIRKGPVRTVVDERGMAVLPAVTVPQSGFEVFNYLVLTVHRPGQKSVYLRNADGSFPDDPRIRDGNWAALSEEDFEVERMVFVSVLRLNEIRTAQGGKGPIVLDFSGNFQ